MADISKITLPSGTTYNIKDETARDQIANKIEGVKESINNNVVVFDGVDGKTVKDSGFTIEKSVPANAKFTDSRTTLSYDSVTEILSITITD